MQKNWSFDHNTYWKGQLDKPWQLPQGLKQTCFAFGQTWQEHEQILVKVECMPTPITFAGHTSAHNWALSGDL